MARRNNKVNSIFRFELFDAWGGTVHKVDVLSNNTVITTNGYFGGENVNNPVTVTEDTISRIKEIIEKNNRILTFKKSIAPADTVLDGYYERFFFSNGEKENNVLSYNLLCCDETNDRANIIKSVLKQIAEVLVQQGFDRELFLLYKPRTFEPDDILDLEDALEVADRYMNNIELCTETGDAYIFSNHRIEEKETEGGPEPVIILKRGGKRVSCLDYYMDKEKLGLRQEDHEIIDEYSICFR